MLYATTVPPFKADDVAENASWLANIDALSDDADDTGETLHLFLALEVDARGSHIHHRLLGRLRQIGLPYTVWPFYVDDGEDRLSSLNRLHRICMGRNLAIECALRRQEDWLFHVDSDLIPDPKSVSKMLDVEHPVVGGEIPQYCLTGEEVLWRPPCKDRDCEDADKVGHEHGYGYRVERHANTAGYLLLHRDIFRRFRWGHDDYDTDLTDDFWTQDLIRRATGVETLVRKDCVGRHRGLIPLEERGHDLALRRM